MNGIHQRDWGVEVSSEEARSRRRIHSLEQAKVKLGWMGWKVWPGFGSRCTALVPDHLFVHYFVSRLSWFPVSFPSTPHFLLSPAQWSEECMRLCGDGRQRMRLVQPPATVGGRSARTQIGGAPV